LLAGGAHRFIVARWLVNTMTQWFLNSVTCIAPELRLFCIPYAGAGAAVYRDWGRLLPGFDVLAVQPPGRGWRLAEPARADLKVLAAEIAEAIEPLADAPFALFGHSMGAWLALLVARRLEERGRRPVALFASGRQAPALGSLHAPMAHLDDEQFLEQVDLRYGGIPGDIRHERELLELLLPALRADVAAIESYVHRSGPRLTCPVAVLGGDADPLVPVESLSGWAAETGGPFEVRTFGGGHFYFQPDPGPLFEYLTGAVAGGTWRRSSLRVVSA
jgi:surfactin synthase thioesterase subunit